MVESRLFVRVLERARAVCPPLVFPEGTDGRIVEGAVRAHGLGICRATIVGDADAVRAVAAGRGVALGGIPVVDPERDARLAEFVEEYRRSRTEGAGKEIKEGAARRTITRPLFFGAMLVRGGHAAGMVAGAEATTASVLTAATAGIGLAPGFERPCSAFLMAGPDQRFGHEGMMVFCDPAVIIDPTAAEMAHMAVQAADLMRLVLGAEPRVALLSFSSNGSAQHPLVDKVREAGRLLGKLAPSIAFDAEVQLDTALVPEIAARKFPGNRMGGRANVLIFPDLDAANIAYKLAERLCGWRAIGPFMLGLRAPSSDLSRGCSVDDIVETAAVVACMVARP